LTWKWVKTPKLVVKAGRTFMTETLQRETYMMEETRIERTSRVAPTRWARASWGAIFAGMFVTVVLQVMLTLLGAAIGFATINPVEERNPAQGMGTASGIWLLLSALVSVWVGACVAGRLAGGARRDGMIHGIVTWSVATSLTLLLLASATGALIGGAGTLLGNAMRIGAQRQSGSSSGDMISAATEQVRSAFPQAGSMLPPTGREQAGQTPGQLTALAAQDPDLAAALTRAASSDDAQSRDQVVNILTTKHNMDQQTAVNLFNEWHQNYQQAHAQVSQKAREVGQQAAHGIAQGALWAFIALLLGLVTSAWGGWVGASSLPRTDLVQTTSPVT
jgi:hypothetical protein